MLKWKTWFTSIYQRLPRWYENEEHTEFMFFDEQTNDEKCVDLWLYRISLAFIQPPIPCLFIICWFIRWKWKYNSSYYWFLRYAMMYIRLTHYSILTHTVNIETWIEETIKMSLSSLVVYGVCGWVKNKSFRRFHFHFHLPEVVIDYTALYYRIYYVSGSFVGWGENILNTL